MRGAGKNDALIRLTHPTSDLTIGFDDRVFPVLMAYALNFSVMQRIASFTLSRLLKAEMRK